MPIYLFLDEAGNFDFGPTGTRYLVFACIRLPRPFGPLPDLLDLKYDLIETGVAPLSHFHASEDRQVVRDAVFSVVLRHLDGIRVDAFVVDKSLAVPGLRQPEVLYAWALRRLLVPILMQERASPRTLHIFTDRLPINRRRELTEKAVKLALGRALPAGIRFQLLHHESRTNLNLQLADYFTWAIFRKWERGDTRSYDLISSAVLSERLAFNPSK